MSHTIARVHVEDFDSFVQVFGTRGKERREQFGSRGVTVFHGTEDPSEVINVFDWDREDVERFMADPETAELMKAVGLKHRPEFTFVEKAAEFEA